MFNSSSSNNIQAMNDEIVNILKRVHSTKIEQNSEVSEVEENSSDNDLENDIHELFRDLNDDIDIPLEEYVDIEYEGISLLFLAAYVVNYEAFIKLLVAGGNALATCKSGPNIGISPVNLIKKYNNYLADFIYTETQDSASSNNSFTQNEPVSFTNLLEEFYNTVNKVNKSLSDIRKIRNLCISASKLLLENNISPKTTNEIIIIEANIQSNPVEYYKYKNFLECCIFYNEKFNRSVVYKNFINNFNELHKFSYDAWIPDFSFLSITPPTQTILGKNKPIFPLGLLLQMHKSYWLTDFNNEIKYFDTSEKKNSKLRIDMNNNLYLSDQQELEDGSYMYVVTPKGGLIILKPTAEEQEQMIYNHSTLRAGQPVMSAGEIEIKDKKIISISNSSGHMLTPELNLLICAIFLKDKGYLDESCKIIISYSQLNSSIKKSSLLDLSVLTGNQFTLKELTQQISTVFTGEAYNFIQDLLLTETKINSKKMKF